MTRRGEGGDLHGVNRLAVVGLAGRCDLGKGIGNGCGEGAVAVAERRVVTSRAQEDQVSLAISVDVADREEAGAGGGDRRHGSEYACVRSELDGETGAAFGDDIGQTVAVDVAEIVAGVGAEDRGRARKSAVAVTHQSVGHVGRGTVSGIGQAAPQAYIDVLVSISIEIVDRHEAVGIDGGIAIACGEGAVAFA